MSHHLWSQTLTPEYRYSTTRKELLAIVEFTKHFHRYLYGLNHSRNLRVRWPDEWNTWLSSTLWYSIAVARNRDADGLSQMPPIKETERIESTEEVASVEETGNPTTLHPPG